MTALPLRKERNASASSPEGCDFSAMRRNMVKSQLLPCGISEARVIRAMEVMPRETFVPPQVSGIAYMDCDLPLSAGRFMLRPTTQAMLLQEAGIGPDSNVLDVGAAAGYSTALLATMAGKVTGLESDAWLAALATDNIRHAQVGNATIRHGILRSGWQATAPYDVIILQGSVSEVPERLAEQLANGGRLAAVFRLSGITGNAGELRIYTKQSGGLDCRTVCSLGAAALMELETARLSAL